MLASEYCKEAERQIDKALQELRAVTRRLKYLNVQYKAVRKKLGIKK